MFIKKTSLINFLGLLYQMRCAHQLHGLRDDSPDADPGSGGTISPRYPKLLADYSNRSKVEQDATGISAFSGFY
jgi:hypothetical protein